MLQYNPTISGSLNITGSLIISNGMIGTVNGVDVQIFSSSISQVVTNIQTTTGSQSGRLTSIESFTSSTSARLGSIETVSASNIGRLNSLEAKTGSLATTGSNTFIGTQTITGSLFISSDLIVQGSSSLQNITASAVSIGTNIVNLNTANPAIRYAGLSIGDSGSVGGSGSFLYDSVQDEMIFVHRGTSTVVTSSVTLMGPQTYDNIGNETYPTSNYIQKGTGNEHLGDSCIFDDGTTTCVKNNLIGTGTMSGTTLYGSTTVCSPIGLFSGCVGIGTASPSQKLHVAGTVHLGVGGGGTAGDVTGVLSIGNTGTYYMTQIKTINTQSNPSILKPRMGFFTLSGTGETAADLTEKMSITADTGKVGIGTTTPQSTLHIGPSLNSMPAATSIAVPGDTSIRFMAGSDGNANYGSFIAGTQVSGVRALSLGSRQGEGDIVTMTLTQGNVGIGAISPNAPLHICNTCTITNMSIQNVNCGGYALYQAKSACTVYTWQWGSWNDGTYRIGQSGVGDYMTIATTGTACFSNSPSGIMGLGTKVHEGTYNVYTGPSCVLTLPINYGTASSIYLFGTLLGNDSMHYAHMMYYYRNDFAGFVGSTITQMSCHNVSTAGQRYTFSVVDPGGLGKSGCLLQINITCANGPSVGAGSYYTRFKIVVYNI